MAKLDAFLAKMLELGASDLHLHADYPLTYRIDGILTKKGNPLTNRNLIGLFGEILTQDQKVRLNRGQELDFAYEIGETARYRGNIFLQDGKFGGVFRLIPHKIQDFELLGIPEGVRLLCEKKSGLILVTGPTGSGKSTTMAAMIDYLNRTRAAHILTIEDPIEFVHTSQNCLVTQKEVGLDINSFEQGLKAAFSENPDIVLVGEIRDQASMTSALDLAESGVFVLATLHTMDVANTVKRVISFYRDESQFMIRSRFATNVAGVISMRLLPSVEGGRIAAFEIMISNTAFCSLIQEKKEHQIDSFIEQGRAEGMKTFAMDIKDLVAQRRISKDAADMYLKVE